MSDTTPSPAIEFDAVTFSFDGEQPVLDGLSLVVERGEYIAVLGSNGSGKSTLAKMVNALHLPDAGTVTVMGLSTADDENLYDIRCHAGLVFQDPDDQMITTLVGDDVAFGPENLGLAPDEIDRRVDESLRAVAMQDFAGRETTSLSGGQKQRVAIAGILAMDPDIVVLDEPGAMLDPRGRRGIIRVSHELAQRGITVVLITHFMNEAVNADRVVVLDRGRIALEGPPSEVFTQYERLHDLQLEEPFSVQLTAALRERGVYVPFTVSEGELQEALCR